MNSSKVNIKDFKKEWEGKEIEISSFSELPAFQLLNIAKIIDNENIIIEINEVDLKKRTVFLRCESFLTIVSFKKAQKLVKNTN